MLTEPSLKFILILLLKYANTGLDNSKMMILIWKKRIPKMAEKNEELQTILNQHLARMLKVAGLLNVSRNAYSKHLKAIRKIQKKGKWIPHELSELAIQNYNTCLSLLSRHKKKQVLYCKL